MTENEKKVMSTAVTMMNGDESAADTWVKLPRELFGQRSALEAANLGDLEKVLVLIGRIENSVFS